MAIYVTSDLHGLELKKLKVLLKKVKFNADDWLYILGDVVDGQNDGGVEILVWLLEQYNVQLILGNHEAMLLANEFVFNEITEDSIKNIDAEKLEFLNMYLSNGGDVTLKNLKILKASDNETFSSVFEYLKDCPVYETVSAGGNDFLLCHSGIDNFEKTKKLSQYSADDFIWAWPEITDEYYDDICKFINFDIMYANDIRINFIYNLLTLQLLISKLPTSTLPRTSAIASAQRFSLSC